MKLLHHRVKHDTSHVSLTFSTQTTGALKTSKAVVSLSQFKAHSKQVEFVS